MSKKYTLLWPRVVAFENLYQAFKRAARGKRGKPSAAGFEYNLESNLLALQDELITGAYQPRGVRQFSDQRPQTAPDLRRPFPRPGGAPRLMPDH